MTSKNVWRLVASLSMSALFLWLAFRRVSWVQTLEELRQAHWGYIALFLFCLCINQLCRIHRWGALIRPFAPISTSRLWRISNIGILLIMVLPLRLGEFVRPYLLKKESGVPLSAGLGSVAVERSIDGLMVTLIFFVSSVWVPAPYAVPAALQAGAWVALAVFVGALVVIVSTLATHGAVSDLIRRWGSRLAPGFTDKIVGLLNSFVTGLQSLPNWRAIVTMLGLTGLYWASNGLGLYFLMRSFGWELPWVAGVLVVCVLALGVMIPAGPGHLGTFQGALLAGLGVFEVNATEAAAYGLIAYPVSLLVVVAFGLPYLIGRRMNVGQLVHDSAETVGEAA